MPSESFFVRLPPELIVSIFGALPSFSDGAWFAATCRRHRRIWVEYAYSIYRHVAPRTIPCRKHARVLLSDQGGPPASVTDLSFSEVLQLIRNAAVVEQSVADFERNHISRVRENEVVKSNPRSPFLSRTERIRYIRGLYQLWGLALLKSETRQQRIRSLKLKDLIVVRDLALSYAVCIPDPTVLGVEDGDPLATFEMVFVDLYPHLEGLVSDLYDEDISSWSLPHSEGFQGRISIWDSYYDMFKSMVLKGAGEKPWPDPERLWDDTSDEDRIEETI